MDFLFTVISTSLSPSIKVASCCAGTCSMSLYDCRTHSVIFCWSWWSLYWRENCISLLFVNMCLFTCGNQRETSEGSGAYEKIDATIHSWIHRVPWFSPDSEVRKACILNPGSCPLSIKTLQTLFGIRSKVSSILVKVLLYMSTHSELWLFCDQTISIKAGWEGFGPFFWGSRAFLLKFYEFFCWGRNFARFLISLE